jgi:hypothetical protein
MRERKRKKEQGKRKESLKPGKEGRKGIID